MSIHELRQVFMWCSIINICVLVFSFIMLCTARGWVYKIHSQGFPVTEQQFNIAMYIIMGIYKVLAFVFAVIPWIALCIVSG